MPAITFELPHDLAHVGCARGSDGSWPPAYEGPAGNGEANKSQALPISLWVVSNGLLRFDTSALPDDAEIESAVLQLNVELVVNANGRKLVADWYDYGGDPVVAGDYTTGEPATALAGVSLSSISRGYRSFSLQNAGANVNKQGFTGLRLSISGGQPSGENFVGYTQEWSSSKPPKLIVTYAGSEQQPVEEGGSQPQSATFPQPSASPALPRRTVLWQFQLCDALFRPISPLTEVAHDKSLSYRLRRPASFSFRVASKADEIARIHTDGLPRLCELERTVRGYRQEMVEGMERWVLRYAGWVWQVSDEGDPETAMTKVTCYDPLQVLADKRFTAPAGDPLATFADVDGGSIARALVDYTNALGPTGITTEGGTFEATPKRTVGYDRTSIGVAIVALASAFNGFDPWFEPFDKKDADGNPVYDGTMVRMHSLARLGKYQKDVVLGWGIWPFNVLSAKRLLDGHTAATHVTGLGANGIVSVAESEATLRLEAVSSYTDITNQELLDALVAEELRFRSRPRELVSMTPAPGIAFEPFTHINLGDSFRSQAGEELRGGFAGIQRCYGFDCGISDEGVESLTRIITAPEE